MVLIKDYWRNHCKITVLILPLVHSEELLRRSHDVVSLVTFLYHLQMYRVCYVLHDYKDITAEITEKQQKDKILK